MNREIKFRQPHSCQSGHHRWSFWELANKKDSNTWFTWGPKHPDCNCPTAGFNEGFTAIGPHQQFSGISDSNGKEIYEGDRLIYVETNMSSIDVVFKDGCFIGEGPFNENPLITYFKSGDFQSIEVQGNKYENPEIYQ